MRRIGWVPPIWGVLLFALGCGSAPTAFEDALCSAESGVPQTWPEPLPVELDALNTALVPAGSAQYREPTETQRGRVKIKSVATHELSATQDFRVMVSELTWGDIARFGHDATERAAASKQDPNRPAVGVSVLRVALVANNASVADGLQPCMVVREYPGFDQDYEVEQLRSCSGYRIPTAAEWRYIAARARPGVLCPSGALGDNVGHPARAETQPPGARLVGDSPAQGFGLKDLIGNLEEYVWGFPGLNTTFFRSNPTGPGASLRQSQLVSLGGSWNGSYGARPVRGLPSTPSAKAGAGWRLLRVVQR